MATPIEGIESDERYVVDPMVTTKKGRLIDVSFTVVDTVLGKDVAGPWGVRFGDEDPKAAAEAHAADLNAAVAR